MCCIWAFTRDAKNLTFGIYFATRNVWGVGLCHMTLSTLKWNLLWQSYERIVIKVQSSELNDGK